MRSRNLPLILCALALAFSGCKGSTRAAAAKTEAVKEAGAEVKTTLVRRGSILPRITAAGSLLARRESQIGAQVTGRIERVMVTVGDRVEVDQPLFEIDPETYKAALAQAAAGLELARAQRQQSEADLGRARALRAQDLVPQQQLDRLATQLAVARAQEKEAAEVVAMARQNLDKTVVRAPYAGSISKRLADEGTMALTMPQTIVIVLQETEVLEARVGIPESQLSLVKPGDKAYLHVQGVPDSIETTVSAVSDSIDPTTRTYLVKMLVPNADRNLKAGVFAHVDIVPQSLSEVLLIPPDAVRTEDGETRVLTVRDGLAVPVPVRIGVATEEAVEVISGLEAGTEVIVGEGARTIAPGMRVRAQPAGGSST
ncbi:MAG TPA: efflux RND transporter periplasmic adaptor subunit [Myxococcota bacterium]|nr:efflux RND transporter periplasmic adaptor subunit [Myxococcota bacterium]